MWPLEMTIDHFAAVTPKLITGHARNQAMAMIWGAQLLPNGAVQLAF